MIRITSTQVSIIYMYHIFSTCTIYLVILCTAKADFFKHQINSTIIAKLKHYIIFLKGFSL